VVFGSDAWWRHGKRRNQPLEHVEMNGKKERRERKKDPKKKGEGGARKAATL
jgi:hypothetical protein